MATSYLEDFGDDVFDALTKYGVKNNPNDSIPELAEHYHFKPLFGLDYISLDQSPFCFNNPAIPARDFVELLKRCSSISKLKYSELHNVEIGNGYHFHEVDKAHLDAHGLRANFQKKMTGRTKALPPVYQFALYTDKETAPRVLGYIGKWGIFYLLWFDYGHLLYPRDTLPAPPVDETPKPVIDEAPALRSDGKPKRARIPFRQ